MFTPNGITPAGAKSGAFIMVPDANHNTVQYFEEFAGSDRTTQGVVAALVMLTANMAESAVVANAAVIANCQAMFSGNAARSIINLVRTAPPDPQALTDNDELNALTLSNLPSAQQWFCDLINAAKKKDLTPTNCEGLFAAYGGGKIKGNDLRRFINQAKAFFPDLIMFDAFRDGLSDITWNDYHSTRVHAGPILMRLVDDFIKMRIIEEGGVVHQAIIDANDNTHSLEIADQIPRKYIGYASVFLDSCGTPIDDWVQGNREKDLLPSAKVKGMKAIFKKYLTLVNHITDVDAATTIPNLNAMVPADYW